MGTVLGHTTSPELHHSNYEMRDTGVQETCLTLYALEGQIYASGVYCKVGAEYNLMKG